MTGSVSWLEKHADAQTLPVLFYPIFCASFWSVDVVLLELIKNHTTKFIASFYTGKNNLLVNKFIWLVVIKTLVPFKRARLCITHNYHFVYTIAIWCKAIYTWRCVNLRQKLSHNKTVCNLLHFCSCDGCDKYEVCLFLRCFLLPLFQVWSVFSQPQLSYSY